MKFHESLREAFPDNAEELVSLFRGETEPASYRWVSDWLDKCYHMPSRNEQMLAAVDGIIGGFGVEALWPEGWENLRVPAAAYVNIGDTYDTTLILDYMLNKWRVMSWGDWMEEFEHKMTRSEV